MLINSSLFTGIADRLAKQVEYVLSGLDQAAVEGTGSGYHFDRVTSANDYNIENDLITSAYNQDNSKLVHNTNLRTVFSDLASNLETHVINQGKANLDAYLTGSGIDVDCKFDSAYYASKNNHLLSHNVFGPIINLATMDFTSSGVMTFTDGDALCTSSNTEQHTDVPTTGFGSGKHAASVLDAYVTSGTSGYVIGANNIILDVHLTEENGNTRSRQVTITSGKRTGYWIVVGGETEKYIDVTSVGGAGGDTGDQVCIRSRLLREVSL